LPADPFGVALLAGLVLLLDTLGLAAGNAALTPDRTAPFTLPLGSLSATITPARVIAVGGLLALVLARERPQAAGRATLAVLAATLAFAVSAANTDAFFAPSSNWGQQWQTYYSVNGNLTEGLKLSANLREGHGYTFDNGKFDSYRMPGYAALVTAAAVGGGDAPRDYRAVATDTIWLQILLTAAAMGVFVFAAAGRLGRPVLLVLVLLLIALPTNVQFTQGDSIMFAAGLLATSALLPFLDRARGDRARRHDVILLHLAFGGYYLLRTDVVIAWAVVSVIVHWRRWRHLAVWAVTFVAIGAGYGAYAKASGSEFTFGTNNTGHVAFVGLWELPQDRFVWRPADESYDQWISAHGYTYRGPGANAFAEKQVLRFYVTYPGYVTTMAVTKALRFFDDTGVADGYQPSPVPGMQRLRVVLANGGLWLLGSAILVALLAGYRRYETVVLGWAALFVLPVFFFVQDENRFTLFEAASLGIAGLPLLTDRGFYRAVAARWRPAVPLVVALAAIWFARSAIENGLLDWDGFRYWTPLLDPAHSTLAVFKR
jgi:hypothetical protein